MNKDNENNEIIEFISEQRLQRYLLATGGDLAKALELYKENMRLSASFYPILSCFEVCLRNRAHKIMTAEYGVAWLIDPNFPMEDDYRKTVHEVYQELRKEHKIGNDVAENMGRVIAGVSLGFWVRLFGKKYEKLFGGEDIRRAFPNYKGRLKPLRNKIYMIKRLRNRIAHHEPIIFIDNLEGRRDEILEVIGWMSEDAREWVASFRMVNCE